MTEVLSKHFITFYSPGTFVAEQTTLPVDSWDVDAGAERAHSVKERHGATPYAFQFTTRSRGADDLDSRVTARSPLYHLGGKIETLAQVKARADPKERILVGNMEGNGYDRIVVNDNSWRSVQPLGDTDVVLDWSPRAPADPC